MPKLMVFDPEHLAQVAKSVVGLSGEELVAAVRGQLQEAYPGHICDHQGWLFSNAGGCMYSFTILHASIFEYVLIFGTVTGTQGHTGRHLASIWDFVLDGELWYFDEDNPTERRVHVAGDNYFLKSGESQGLNIPQNAWVLEYARGFIPSLLPFGVADSMLSTLDLKTAAKTFGQYAKFYPPYLLRMLSGQARL